MATIALEELCKRKKAQTVKLIETADATQRIAEAVERRDELSVQLLLDERERPIRQLYEMEESIQAYLLTLPEAEAIRMNELLHGAAAETEEEKPLAGQSAQYRRMLESVTTLDRQVSLRLGGGQSFYKKFRE